MNSPYQLLASAILDLEAHSEVAEVLAFAKNVVDRFFRDLQCAASNLERYETGFLFISFDNVTFGDPPLAAEKHFASSSTTQVGRFICFPNEMTAEDALRIFTTAEMDVYVFLTMTLISLRQIEVEGSSPMGNILLEGSYDRLKELLARALSTREAA